MTFEVSLAPVPSSSSPDSSESEDVSECILSSSSGWKCLDPEAEIKVERRG